MNDGIGTGHTREDHQNLASQLYALYAKAKRVERLASIIGEEDLAAHDRLFLKFANELEARFIRQAPNENRTVMQTLDLGWELATIFSRAGSHARYPPGTTKIRCQERVHGQWNGCPCPPIKAICCASRRNWCLPGDGLELMDEKKEALIPHITSLAGKAERVRAQMNAVLKEAYGHLRDAVRAQGRLACERAALAPRLDAVLDIREKSFMGVALPVVRLTLPDFFAALWVSWHGGGHG